MLWLNEHIRRIEELLIERAPESLTYAALRCRMAIELVCYHRLRIAHDYISPEDLGRWQPRDVVNRLIQEVDPYIASSYTLSISTRPVIDETAPLSQVEFENLDYVEVGHQEGFDTRRLGKVWNSLGSFLHVRMPKSSGADLATFGDVANIERKVQEALAMLRELEQGTMVSGGFGETVSFECGCGSTNKRRAGRLQHGQTVSCINPECLEGWTVCIDGDAIGFERRTLPVVCKCGETTRLQEKPLLRLDRDQRARFVCESCGAENLVVWRLMSATLGQIATS